LDGQTTTTPGEESQSLSTCLTWKEDWKRRAKDEIKKGMNHVVSLDYNGAFDFCARSKNENVIQMFSSSVTKLNKLLQSYLSYLLDFKKSKTKNPEATRFP